MQFLEKDLEDIIFTHHDKMQARGLSVCTHDLMYRQIQLGSYGICDCLGVNIYSDHRYRAIDMFVYELKKEKIDFNTLGQAMRYKVALESIIGRHNINRTEINIYLILVGKSIEINGDFAFLLGRIPGILSYTYKYDFDGIVFRQERGYTQTYPNLPPANKHILNDIAQVSYAKNQNRKARTLERQVAS